MRQNKDWLRSYLEFTETQESPDIFHLWCGISAISAVLERKVWIDRGYYTLFPNTYVILVAESAVSRKSTAIGIAKGIVKTALPEFPILSQKMTTEALIGALHTSQKGNGISSGYVIASELSVFLGRSAQDATLVQSLTDIYDCPDPFEYHTVGRGVEKCPKSYLCLLGGTTPEWIRSSLPAGSIGGGFTSRIIFVNGNKGWRREAWPELSDEQIKLHATLAADLRSINQLSGEFEISDDAREFFSTWYEKVSDPDSNPEVSLRGYYGRKHDTLLRIGMVIAAGRRDKPVIEEIDLQNALAMLNENERNLPRVMNLIQTNEIGEESMIVLNTIKREKSIPHSKLLQRMSYRMDAAKLKAVVDSLEEADLIEITTDGRKKIYKTK